MSTSYHQVFDSDPIDAETEMSTFTTEGHQAKLDEREFLKKLKKMKPPRPEPRVDFEDDVESVMSTRSTRAQSKNQKQTELTEEEKELLEEKRKEIAKIKRYEARFGLKADRRYSEKDDLETLRKTKEQVRQKIREDRGAEMIKGLYMTGLEGIEKISLGFGVHHFVNLGKVAHAVANDPDNEALWEELAIEYDDMFVLSPQKRILMMTIQILATTHRINNDTMFAAQMANQAKKAAQYEQELNDIQRDKED